MNKYAVAIYYYNKEAIDCIVVKAETPEKAIQLAVGDTTILEDATVQGCINYYWESKQTIVSTPVKI